MKLVDCLQCSYLVKKNVFNEIFGLCFRNYLWLDTSTFILWILIYKFPGSFNGFDFKNFSLLLYNVSNTSKWMITQTLLNTYPPSFGQRRFSLLYNSVCNSLVPSEGSLAFVLQSPQGVGPNPSPPAWLGYYSVFMVPSCVVRPKRRPRVKASCKMYVHAAVSVGGKINIAGLMHGDDWVLSDWQ